MEPPGVVDIMKTYNIAAIPGDGIGKEVVAAGLEVLAVSAERDGGFKLKVESFDWGSNRYKAKGRLMPKDGAEQLRDFDARPPGFRAPPSIPRYM